MAINPCLGTVAQPQSAPVTHEVGMSNAINQCLGTVAQPQSAPVTHEVGMWNPILGPRETAAP
eukprot:1996067-Rhodomonas_salina.1